MPISIRKAHPEDRQRIFEVEQKSTPGLIYLPFVFDQFMNDKEGEFIVGEMDDQLVGCGKFTLLPDGSAWLEALRVIPERKGQGIGKQFYKRFFEIARSKKVAAMRMYTGINNHASKGLAERFGFSIAGTFRGQKLACQPDLMNSSQTAFQPVKDPGLAAGLLLPQRDRWAGFMVMNRTFYAINPSLAAYLAEQEMLYQDPVSQSWIVLGARFMHQQALHIGMMSGDLSGCVAFAIQKGVQAGVASLNCLSPLPAAGIQTELARNQFQDEPSEFIVMEIHLTQALKHNA